MSTAEATIKSEVQEAFETLLDRLPVRDPRRLLFISIPQVPADVFNRETALQRGYQSYPPVGYLYLSAAARLAKPEIELSVLDLNHEMLRRCHLGLLEGDNIHDFWKDLIAAEIGDGDGLHVCVGNMFEVTTPMYLEVTKFIRQTFPRVTLVSGGVETTQNYRRVVEGDHCHIAFRYEAETQFRTFLEACGGISEPTVPDGVAFKLDGEFYETSPGPEPTEYLDIRPYYHLVDVENYHNYGGMNPYSRYVGKEKIFGTALSERGCRSQCTYCGVLAFYPNKVRARSARSVVDEIKFLVEERGVQAIEWLDDDLVYGRKRSVEMFRLMAEELPPDFSWVANNGITGTSITEEMMYWMAESGCKAFKVGVESGNEEMLKKIRKPATKDGLRKFTTIFKKYPEIHVSGNYIIGFPGETFGEMMDTFDFANELSWDWANIYICQPARGSRMYSAFEALGDDRCQEDHFGGLIPARFAQQKGDFGYHKAYHSDNGIPTSILSGRDVFDLPKDLVPTQEQIKEIWFTFNLVTNFFNNHNLGPGGNLEKLARWYESIISTYPRDATMCAMLAHVYRLLNDREQSERYRERFHRLHEEYEYWKRRVEEFPELLEYAR